MRKIPLTVSRLNTVSVRLMCFYCLIRLIKPCLIESRYERNRGIELMDSFKTSNIGNTAAIKVRVEPKPADGMRVTVSSS